MKLVNQTHHTLTVDGREVRALGSADICNRIFGFANAHSDIGSVAICREYESFYINNFGGLAAEVVAEMIIVREEEENNEEPI